jgi:hypothetical protein
MPPPDAVIVNARLPLFAEVLTFTVSVDDQGLPAIGFTLKDGEMPVLAPLTDKEMGELKVPDGVTVTVNCAAPGRLIVAEVGETAIVKLAFEVTTTLAEALCCRVPLVPVTEKEYVPGATFAATVNAKLAEFMGAAVMPAGNPLTVQPTLPLNPPMGVEVAV